MSEEKAVEETMRANLKDQRKALRSQVTRMCNKVSEALETKSAAQAQALLRASMGIDHLAHKVLTNGTVFLEISENLNQ